MNEQKHDETMREESEATRHGLGSESTPIVSETSVLIENYKVVADWIRFADTKAAVLLAVQGALIGLFVPMSATFYERVTRGEFPSRAWPAFVIGSDVVWFGLFLASSLMALRCINPHAVKGVHVSIGQCDHFHPAAIASCYKSTEQERFVRDYTDLGPDGFKREVLVGIFMDSFISNYKYKCVRAAIRLFALELAAGFVFYAASRL